MADLLTGVSCGPTRRVSIYRFWRERGLTDAALAAVFPIMDGCPPLASYPTRQARRSLPGPKTPPECRTYHTLRPIKESMPNERLTSLIHDQLETDLYGTNQTGHAHGPDCECKPSKHTHTQSSVTSAGRPVSSGCMLASGGSIATHCASTRSPSFA